MKIRDNGLVELDPDEVETVFMKVGDALRAEFSRGVKVCLDPTRQQGIPDQVVMAAVVIECLVLTAHMHLGTDDSFVAMARSALKRAKENRENIYG